MVFWGRGVKICVLSDYDSRIKWGLSVARGMNSYFNSDQVEVDLYYKSFDKELITYYDIKVARLIEYSGFQDILGSLANFNVVILALGGGLIAKVMHAINTFGQSRPIVVTGFNGLTDPHDPHGLLCRYGSDVICVNSPIDYWYYVGILKSLGLSYDSLVLTGIQRSYIDVSSAGCLVDLRWRDSILFVEQIGIPISRSQLRYLIDKLIDIAILNPHRDVLIKCREKAGYKTVNSSERNFRFRDVWKDSIVNPPNNIKFVDDNIEKLLVECTLCIAFTSSAIIEALLLNKEVAVISDFGVSRKIGNHVFLGSGLLVKLDDIARSEIPKVNLRWYQNNCLLGKIEALGDRIARLMSNDTNDILPIYFNRNNYPYYFLEKETSSNGFKNFFLNKVRRFYQCLRYPCGN